MGVLLLLAASFAFAADLPSSQIVDDVKCAADPAQSYSLYVPSYFTPQRLWPVIFAFDPRARGRIPVERYRAAAEMYGYIVAGSNNSRNGSWSGSIIAAQAMSDDVVRRFPIDPKRLYTAGMSGGARVALGVALQSDMIAGVIASSAGYPDSKPRKSLPFPVFGIAGWEDFNYLEMRLLDRELKTPHRLRIFEGGHVWLSSELAVEAVEWLEIQGIRSGRIARDPQRIDAIWGKRTAAANAAHGPKEECLALEQLAADFHGIKDIADLKARAGALRRDKQVRDELKREREEEDREQRKIDEVFALENQLTAPDQRPAALVHLRDLWKRLAADAHAAAESANRRLARRVLFGLDSGASERTEDAGYLKIIEEHRRPRSAAR
jgi:hypothetical protein